MDSVKFQTVFELLIFYWLFYLITFQMLSLFLVSPPQIPYTISLPPASLRELPQQPTHSCLSTLAFPYAGASSLHRTKGNPHSLHGAMHLQGSSLRPCYFPCLASLCELHIYHCFLTLSPFSEAALGISKLPERET